MQIILGLYCLSAKKCLKHGQAFRFRLHECNGCLRQRRALLAQSEQLDHALSVQGQKELMNQSWVLSEHACLSLGQQAIRSFARSTRQSILTLPFLPPNWILI